MKEKKAFHSTGGLQYHEIMHDDTGVVEIKTYYRSGQLHKHYNTKDGVLEGMSVEYSDAGDLFTQLCYRGGDLDGEALWYGLGGKLRQRSTYEYGSLNGLQETFYQSGDILSSANYVNDRLHGIFYHYRTNGKLRSRAKYARGKLDGIQEIVSEDGTVTGRAYYCKGRDITKKIEMLVEDIDNITLEEEFIIKMKLGIDAGNITLEG